MPAPDRPIDILARSLLFQGLAPDDCGAMAAELRPVKFDSGQLIFSRGDAGNDMYLVTEGRIRLSVLTGEGRELSFSQVGPGGWFGEIAMLDGGVRTADATAVARSSGLSLSKGAYLRASSARPAIADAMTRFLCSRIRDADQQLETIALYPIEGRLARFFLASARQTGKSGGRVSIDLGMSQSDLALLVGASRPKVNTALSMLEASGAIARAGSRIECDIEELKLIAGGE